MCGRVLVGLARAGVWMCKSAESGSGGAAKGERWTWALGEGLGGKYNVTCMEQRG